MFPPPDLAFTFTFTFALFLSLCSHDSLLPCVFAAQVQLTIQISNFKSNPPFAVVLYSASSRTPIGVPPHPTALTCLPLTFELALLRVVCHVCLVRVLFVCRARATPYAFCMCVLCTIE